MEGGVFNDRPLIFNIKLGFESGLETGVEASEGLAWCCGKPPPRRARVVGTIDTRLNRRLETYWSCEESHFMQIAALYVGGVGGRRSSGSGGRRRRSS